MYISFALGSQREPHFQWNIGGGGSPTQRFCVGHVHFMLFVSILFASGTQRKPVFQWSMGLRNEIDNQTDSISFAPTNNLSRFCFYYFIGWNEISFFLTYICSVCFVFSISVTPTFYALIIFICHHTHVFIFGDVVCLKKVTSSEN